MRDSMHRIINKSIVPFCAIIDKSKIICYHNFLNLKQGLRCFFKSRRVFVGTRIASGYASNIKEEIVMGYELTGDQYKTAFRRIGEIQRQLGQATGYPYDPNGLLGSLQAISEGRFADIARPHEILRLISGGRNLIIPATDGSELISQAKGIFPGGIDPDFINLGANEPGDPTPDTPVDVYELVRNATLAQMFDSICAYPERLCLEQSQIIGFVQMYPKWLHPRGWPTFFPFQSKDNFFVAPVYADVGGRLFVDVSRRECDYVWDAEFRYRIVLPQLWPLVS